MTLAEEPELLVADDTENEDLAIQARSAEVIGQQKKRIPGPLAKEIREKPMARIEIVGPAKAEEWLAANTHNRDLRPHRVMSFAGMIYRGEWQVTTDGIGFDTTGVLLNGQHRLTAIVVADLEVPIVVVRGLLPSAQAVTDQNLTRTLGDTLKLMEKKNYFVLAGALGWMYRLGYCWETGNVHYSDPGKRPSITQLLDILEAHPGLEDMPKEVSRVRRTVKVRAASFMALWYNLRLIDREEADLFVDKLANGDRLLRTDPIHLLRVLLIREAQQRSRSLADYREVALTIKGWNAWREQKPMVGITFKYGPRVKERFPKPI